MHEAVACCFREVVFAKALDHSILHTLSPEEMAQALTEGGHGVALSLIVVLDSGEVDQEDHLTEPVSVGPS